MAIAEAGTDTTQKTIARDRTKEIIFFILLIKNVLLMYKLINDNRLADVEPVGRIPPFTKREECFIRK